MALCNKIHRPPIITEMLIVTNYHLTTPRVTPAHVLHGFSTSAKLLFVSCQQWLNYGTQKLWWNSTFTPLPSLPVPFPSLLSLPLGVGPQYNTTLLIYCSRPLKCSQIWERCKLWSWQGLGWSSSWIKIWPSVATIFMVFPKINWPNSIARWWSNDYRW